MGYCNTIAWYNNFSSNVDNKIKVMLQIVSFRLARILRNLGMPQEDGIYYTPSRKKVLERPKNGYFAPKQEEVLSWFREKGFHVFTKVSKGGWSYFVYSLKEQRYCVRGAKSPLYQGYNKCLEAAIYYVIRFCRLRVF